MTECYTQKYVFLENLLFIVVRSNQIIKLNTGRVPTYLQSNMSITSYLQSDLQRFVDLKCLRTEMYLHHRIIVNE